MALLTTQVASSTGIAPVYGAASAGGDTFGWGDDVGVHVKNGGGASVTVTVSSPGVCSHGGTHDLVVPVPAGSERLIGPVTPANRYVNPATGLVNVGYSATASVTVAVLRV